MIKKTIFGLLAFSTLTMFVSCSTNNTYNSFQKVKNYKWSNKDTLFFSPNIKDISKEYDIYFIPQKLMILIKVMIFIYQFATRKNMILATYGFKYMA